MIKILTENGTPSYAASSLTSRSPGRINGIHFAFLAAMLIMTYASDSFANRPSMQDDEYDSTREAGNGYGNTEEPSSVEMMMQQQTQQTGDVLNLPAQEIQAGETIKIKLLDLPRRGTSMDKVKQDFGEPMDASDSVGKPPITSWTYSDRIVYFEYSTVLHVVAR